MPELNDWQMDFFWSSFALRMETLEWINRVLTRPFDHPDLDGLDDRQSLLMSIQERLMHHDTPSDYVGIDHFCCCSYCGGVSLASSEGVSHA